MGARQTGFPFNSILNLEIERAQHPLNPFINASVIEVSSLIKPLADRQPFKQIIMFTREICHDPQITLNNEIFESEDRTGDTDRSLAYYLKANGIMQGDVTASLTTYFKQCSMMVTAVSLANLGAVLANNGVKPWDQDRLISSQAATYAKSLMMTTGLYNESGTYSSIIGVPTKSGVGGGFSRFIDSQGRVVNQDINRRTIGIDLSELKKKKHSILVAANVAKVPAINGVLTAGYANTLVIDQESANDLLTFSPES